MELMWVVEVQEKAEEELEAEELKWILMVLFHSQTLLLTTAYTPEPDWRRDCLLSVQ